MLWNVIPYYNLISCGGSSNKNVAGTVGGEDGITLQSEYDDIILCYFAKGKYSTDRFNSYF